MVSDRKVSASEQFGLLRFSDCVGGFCFSCPITSAGWDYHHPGGPTPIWCLFQYSYFQFFCQLLILWNKLNLQKVEKKPWWVQFVKRKLLCGAPWKGLGPKNKVPWWQSARSVNYAWGDPSVLSSPASRQKLPYLLFASLTVNTVKREQIITKTVLVYLSLWVWVVRSIHIYNCMFHSWTNAIVDN